MYSILIVDDSPAVRKSLCELLEGRNGWTVCGEAENGREGVDKALKLSPDLVVLDLSMPVMNGLQAARQLRRLIPRLQILMFTTFCGPELAQEAFAAGANAVRSKEDGVEELCRSIQDLLPAPGVRHQINSPN